MRNLTAVEECMEKIREVKGERITTANSIYRHENAFNHAVELLAVARDITSDLADARETQVPYLQEKFERLVSMQEILNEKLEVIREKIEEN